MVGNFVFKKSWLWIKFRFMLSQEQQKIFILFLRIPVIQFHLMLEKNMKKKLFKIPQCFKINENQIELDDCIEGSELQVFFLKRTLKNNTLILF